MSDTGPEQFADTARREGGIMRRGLVALRRVIHRATREKKNTITVNVTPPGPGAEDIVRTMPEGRVVGAAPLNNHWHCPVCSKPHGNAMRAALCCLGGQI